MPWAAWFSTCLPVRSECREAHDFYLPLSPICLLLVPQYALDAVGLFPAFLPLRSGCFGPHDSTPFSYLSPACVLVRSGCFAPHDFFPQTVLGGSTFIGLRSWVTWFCLCLRACVRGRTISTPVCCWCPGVSRFYPCVPLVACLTLCVILHLSPACLALWACWAA